MYVQGRNTKLADKQNVEKHRCVCMLALVNNLVSLEVENWECRTKVKRQIAAIKDTSVEIIKKIRKYHFQVQVTL